MESNVLENQEDISLRLWLDAELQSFDDLLRLNYNKSAMDFADAVALRIGKTTKALRVVFYTVDEETQESVAAAGYACNVADFWDKSFSLGEGFIGQAVKSAQNIYLDDIPVENAYVESAIGKVPASFLAVLPLEFNGFVYGVWEIIFVQSPEDRIVKLLERLAKNTAPMLESINTNAVTKKLLALSKEQAEQMVFQEEVLRQSMEDMMVAQDSLAKNAALTEAVKQQLAAQVDLINQMALLSEFDLDGRITYVNDMFCQVSGHTREELLGQPQSIIRHPETTKDYIKEMWETIMAGKLFRGKYKCITKTGQTYWVDASIAPVLDAEGKPIKFIGIRFDISDEMAQTERLTALLAIASEQESMLKAQEDMLLENLQGMQDEQINLVKQLEQKVMETESTKSELETRMRILDSVALVSESDGNGILTYVNAKFCETSKYSAEELLGKPHGIVLHPDMPKAFFEKMRETLQAGKEFKNLVTNLAKDGTAYTVETTVAPILDANGKLLKYVSVRFPMPYTAPGDIKF